MTVQWSDLDKGTERLILVGPLQEISLQSAVLKTIGLEGVSQIAVDGGIRSAVNPILWAGDGDSGRAPEGMPVFIKYSQDITDLRFCLSGVRDWRWKELHLFGFLGGRRDHELANFGGIHAELKVRLAFSKAVFYDNSNHAQVQFFQAGEHVMELRGTFSVLVLESAEITITGDCRYHVEKMPLRVLSGQGVSNEGTGTVKISSSVPFMLLM